MEQNVANEVSTRPKKITLLRDADGLLIGATTEEIPEPVAALKAASEALAERLKRVFQQGLSLRSQSRWIKLLGHVNATHQEKALIGQLEECRTDEELLLVMKTLGDATEPPRMVKAFKY